MKAMKVLYHASPKNNLGSIITNGIRKGVDGLIYFCDNPSHAAMFVALRGEQEIVSIAVDTSKLDKSKIAEGMDHAVGFFPDDCNVYTYNDSIPSEYIIWEKSMQY